MGSMEKTRSGLGCILTPTYGGLEVAGLRRRAGTIFGLSHLFLPIGWGVVDMPGKPLSLYREMDVSG